MADSDVTEKIALYNPSGAVAIVAFLVFFIVALGHWYRYLRARSDSKYMRLVRWGATFMAFGFIARFTRRNSVIAWSWLFETLFILLSPCAFIAQIYVLLPRLALALEAEDCLLLPPRALKWIFIPADILTVLAQLAGTAMTITYGELVSIGVTLVTVGLVIQLCFFLAFIIIYITFGKRLHRSAVHSAKWYQLHSSKIGGGGWYDRWSTLFLVLGTSCGFMLIRSIYRVAEYAAGAKSGIANSEAAFYILDSLMMFGIVLSFLVVWPPTCLRPLPAADFPMAFEQARPPRPSVAATGLTSDRV